ncbi:SDR family oxidoreductase [Acidithrix ferrooxidans]|uniref:Putative oxidoreductase UxuB n=1 Tax=Acidithrix ferrooxidans TaxID=1280514 RepID=A0A0D8HG57_9ACTN|nr:SDR family oxidoreductase [Acidithrix ferrooxidans]KJF16046.1 putative oxidoreductase UxuB [Acidithrix ferrooxidans]
MIPLNENLKGKTAVITGGSGVLTSAMAKELARHGTNIVILNRNKATGESIVAEIEQRGGTAIAISCDVLDKDSVKAAEALTLSMFGCCDILINGAGGNHQDATTSDEVLSEADLLDVNSRTLYDLEIEGIERVINLNLLGTIIPSQVFSKNMIGLNGATIINISSMSAYTPLTKIPAYSASKAAINNYTAWLAVYLSEVSIRVNAIAPGFFLTNQNRNLLMQEDGSLTQRSKKIIDHTPMKRFGLAEDLLGTLIWLADDNLSGFVTGVTIPIDGGFMAYSGV